MKYVIHGATGAQGKPLFNKLVAEGKNAVAAVRKPSLLKNQATIATDLASIGSLVRAYTGAEGVFIHLPLGPEYIRTQFAQNIQQAISITKPERVVISTSGWQLGGADDESALSILIRGLEKIDVSLAIIAPQLYLENLLLPVVIESVKTKQQLPYPLGADYRVSWCSHLDIADVAAELLLNYSVIGVVEVGQLPAISGNELATSFAKYFNHPVEYNSLTPEEFGRRLTSLFGEAAAAEVVAGYKAKALTQNSAITPYNSAQKLLGIQPRTIEQWLLDIGV